MIGVNLDTKKTHPFITLWKIDKSLDFPEVSQGSVKRDYLDDTYNGHGYHCPPMTVSNISGWEFVLPQDVTVIWDGVSDSNPNHVKIIEGEFYKGKKLVENVTANATIRFLTNTIIQTDEDHYCLVSGAPNYFFDGAIPYSVVLRTDHHYFSETFFGWRITKANTPITFPKGMPFMFIKNYPKSLLGSTNISFSNLDENEELIESMRSSISLGEDFYKNRKTIWQWSGFYKNGITPQYPEGIDIDIRPNLINPKNRESE